MSPQPTPQPGPVIPERWWSPSLDAELIAADGGYYVQLSSALNWRVDLPADAVRLVVDDQIETAWEAATGELEELRRQIDQLRADHAVERAAHEAWLARLSAERDEARAERDRLRAIAKRVEETTTWCGRDEMHRAITYIRTGQVETW